MLSQPLFKVATYLSYGMVEVTEFTLTVKQKQNRSNRYPSSRGLILNRASKAHAAARAFLPPKTPTPVYPRPPPAPPPPPPPTPPAPWFSPPNNPPDACSHRSAPSSDSAHTPERPLPPDLKPPQSGRKHR